MRRYRVKKGRQAARPFVFNIKPFWKKIQDSRTIWFDHTWVYEFEQSGCQEDWLKVWGWDIKTIWPSNDYAVMIAARYRNGKIQVTAYINDNANLHPGTADWGYIELDPPAEGQKVSAVAGIYVDRDGLARIAFGKEHYQWTVRHKFKDTGWLAREINFWHGGNCKALHDINVWK